MPPMNIRFSFKRKSSYSSALAIILVVWLSLIFICFAQNFFNSNSTKRQSEPLIGWSTGNRNLDDAYSTLNFHRSKMNEYLCNNYAVSQPDVLDSKLRRNTNETAKTPFGQYQSWMNKNGDKRLMEDQGSRKYREWLISKATNANSRAGVATYNRKRHKFRKEPNSLSKIDDINEHYENFPPPNSYLQPPHEDSHYPLEHYPKYHYHETYIDSPSNEYWEPYYHEHHPHYYEPKFEITPPCKNKHRRNKWNCSHLNRNDNTDIDNEISGLGDFLNKYKSQIVFAVMTIFSSIMFAINMMISMNLASKPVPGMAISLNTTNIAMNSGLNISNNDNKPAGNYRKRKSVFSTRFFPHLPLSEHETQNFNHIISSAINSSPSYLSVFIPNPNLTLFDQL